MNGAERKDAIYHEQRKTKAGVEQEQKLTLAMATKLPGWGGESITNELNHEHNNKELTSW
jgi:hypothetical protein